MLNPFFIVEKFILLNMGLYARSVERELRYWFGKGKVLVLVGARQVGKTTMLKEISSGLSDVLWLNADQQNVRSRLNNPSLQDIQDTIGNYKVVIIDEVQRIENAGLLLKLMADNFKEVQFIATGSSALEIADQIFEPLTGRQILFHLDPFGLSELYKSKSPFEIEEELPFHLVYGNYPEICVNRDDARTLLENLAQQYLYKDVLIWKDIRKPDLLDELLKLLAYQIGSEVSVNELANQLKVKSETVESYISLLEQSFVIYRMKSYSTNARKEVSKMSKIYFWDNGIRNSVINDFRDLSARNDHGELFENFIISERMKMNAWSKNTAKSYFWRNYNQMEVDYVEFDGDDLKAFEMKWNTNKVYKVTKAFLNLYPHASTSIITPRNFYSFVFPQSAAK